MTLFKPFSSHFLEAWCHVDTSGPSLSFYCPTLTGLAIIFLLIFFNSLGCKPALLRALLLSLLGRDPALNRNRPLILLLSD